MSPPLRHPRLLWSAAAIVGLAELSAAGLILAPRADATYRAYFIERTSDCWPHLTDGTYTLGTTLSFVYGSGHDFAPQKVCGWFYPNAEGTWSYGRYSLLRFKFPPPGVPLWLSFSAGAMVTAAQPVQRVVVSANGTEIATLRLDSITAEQNTLNIPTALADTGSLDLRFDYPDARPGNELGPNEDSHLRAVRMVALTLSVD